jgi:hypothetical protein
VVPRLAPAIHVVYPLFSSTLQPDAGLYMMVCVPRMTLLCADGVGIFHLAVLAGLSSVDTSTSRRPLEPQRAASSDRRVEKDAVLSAPASLSCGDGAVRRAATACTGWRQA